MAPKYIQYTNVSMHISKQHQLQTLSVKLKFVQSYSALAHFNQEREYFHLYIILGPSFPIILSITHKKNIFLGSNQTPNKI